MLEAPHLADVVDDLSGIVETSTALPLWDVASGCDWVIADENSGVHLPVLKLGIPTVPIKQLGLYSRSDMYGFVANGIVFPPVSSIRDVRADVLTTFFSADWGERFKAYDAAYLRSAADIANEVRQAIFQLT